MIHDLEKIFNHFGMKNQLEKLKEETREFLESDNDPSEIADVFVVVSQIYANSALVRDLVEQKIKRTLKRIKTGYYEG